MQGERYFLDERLSVFVGLGYTPRLDQGDPTGPTFAAGLRSFTSGIKHRFFWTPGRLRLDRAWATPGAGCVPVGGRWTVGRSSHHDGNQRSGRSWGRFSRPAMRAFIVQPCRKKIES